MPWKVEISETEKQRFESREWILRRLADSGTTLRPVRPGRYALPLVERDRRLVCLFLDEDGLCSQYRRDLARG